MTNPKVLDKLAKMKAHMESAQNIGSEAEAQAFAAAMQRMMLEHEISMSDIELQQRDVTEPVEEHWIDYSKYGEEPKRARVQWREQLAKIIAEAHFCRHLVHLGSSRITLVGRKSDCEVAEYMIVTLTRLLEKMSLNEWRKEWRRLGGHESPERNREAREELSGFDTAYRNSFINTLARRYIEEIKQATTPTSNDSGSMALVRLDRKTADVEGYMEEKYGDKKKASGLTRGRSSNSLGWARGHDAAQKMNLRGKAVTTSGPKKQLS